MKTKSIFVANLAEIAKPLAQLMNRQRRQEEIFEDHALCDRFLFSQDDQRVLITPFPLNPEYLADSCQIMGYQNLINLFPKKVADSTCEAILEDKKLLDKVIEIIKSNPGLNLISYAATSEFIKLVDFLKQKGLSFQTPELPLTPWTVEFFDSKAGFRQAAQYLGPDFPPLPQGFICSKPQEIVGWVDYFLKKNGGCVMKTNRGLAGAGVKIIRQSEVKGELEPFIQSILKGEPYWQKEPTVVEDFIEVDPSVAGGNPSVEFKVEEKKIIPLYVCGMRVTSEGSFRGVEIGKDSVGKNLEKTLFRAGQLWAEFLQKIGYRGFFDIDWVYAKNGQVYPIESNIRRTGGTHVYELGKRLLGPDYLQNYYLVANNMASAPALAQKSYSLVKKNLSPLLYPIKGQRQGVILTDITYLQKGYLGYVIAGPNKCRVSEIEQSFLKLLS